MRIYLANLFWPATVLDRNLRNILLLCFVDVLGALGDAEKHGTALDLKEFTDL